MRIAIIFLILTTVARAQTVTVTTKATPVVLSTTTQVSIRAQKKAAAAETLTTRDGVAIIYARGKCEIPENLTTVDSIVICVAGRKP